jgi:putative ABC transport system ATP-binding protein
LINCKVVIDLETADRKILKLSGGEQQRVGIARALSHDPDIIIADEPTGNLDTDTENAVLEILSKLASDDNKCVIIVAHSKNVKSIADVVIRIRGGQLFAGVEYHAASCKNANEKKKHPKKKLVWLSERARGVLII